MDVTQSCLCVCSSPQALDTRKLQMTREVPTCREDPPSLPLPTDCLCEPQLLGPLATEAWLDSRVKAHKMWVPKFGSCLSLTKILAQNPSSPVLWVCTQLSQDADCGGACDNSRRTAGEFNRWYILLETSLRACLIPQALPSVCLVELLISTGLCCTC